MNHVLRQRSRIVRVRRLQHDLAASAAAEAAGKVQMLETSRQRLAAMRDDLRADPGITSGSGLARIGELAMRLDAARQGLATTLDNARAAAAQKERLRVSKRRDQESAEKLHKSAAAAAEALTERQMLRTPRRSARKINDGGDQ